MVQLFFYMISKISKTTMTLVTFYIFSIINTIFMTTMWTNNFHKIGTLDILLSKFN